MSPATAASSVSSASSRASTASSSCSSPAATSCATALSRTSSTPTSPRKHNDPGDAVSVEVFAADEQSEVDVDTLRWVRLARDVLDAEGVGGDVEMSMLFVDEPAMAELNRRFLGGEGPTDVLAFPIDEDVIEAGRSPDSGGPGPGTLAQEASEVPIVLGDVVLCPSVAQR